MFVLCDGLERRPPLLSLCDYHCQCIKVHILLVLQLDIVGGKGTGLSSLQDRAGGSSKFSSGDIGSNLVLKTTDYIPSSDYGYGRKIDPFAKGKVSEYPLDRSHYVESQSTYIGRDLQTESARTYSDYSSLSHQYQVVFYPFSNSCHSSAFLIYGWALAFFGSP